MNDRYTKTAIVLHWLIAIFIIALFALGWFMSDLPKEAPKQTTFDLFNLGIFNWNNGEEISPRSFYYNLHKSLGVTVLALIAFRMFWRITHKPPAPLASYKEIERKIAAGAHHLLYLLMFALPISGVIMASYSKYGIKWFGLPLMSGLDNKPARESWVEIHETVGIVLLVILAIHVIGALKHKFIDKDETMKRMLP